tara:strand:+ start:34 stop:684 length:651 start_codon:yes stop_codon:yes gene_type:complete
MTLTNIGTLGLGVTTPINTLHVVGTSTVTSVAHFGNDVNVAGDITTLQGLTAASINLTSSSLSANLTGNVYAATGVSTFNNLTGNSIGIGTDVPAGGGLSINTGDNTVYVTHEGRVGVQTTNTGFNGIDASQTTALVAGIGVGATITVGRAVVDFADAGTVGVVTTNRFMIPPKLTNTQRGQIAAPVAGALIYNTNANRLQFYTGTEWLGIATAAL